MESQEVPTFEELHPYGLEPEEIQIVLWILFGFMIFSVAAYIFTAVKQTIYFGVNSRMLMDIKSKKKMCVQAGKKSKELSKNRKRLEN